MKVVRLKITNFRSIKSAELHFDGHCLIVGPNSVGKSTICEALARTGEAVDSSIRQSELPSSGFNANQDDLSPYHEKLLPFDKPAFHVLVFWEKLKPYGQC